MSMFDMVFPGAREAGRLPLALLGFQSEADVGRYRSAWIEHVPDAPEIPFRVAVYTRNGGGNRDHWDSHEEEVEGSDCTCPGCIIGHRLPRHPDYLYDVDDDFDETYATVYFRVPAEHLEVVMKAHEEDPFPESVDMSSEWLAAIERLRR